MEINDFNNNDYNSNNNEDDRNTYTSTDDIYDYYDSNDYFNDDYHKHNENKQNIYSDRNNDNGENQKIIAERRIIIILEWMKKYSDYNNTVTIITSTPIAD